jgi:hypothetical protein
MLSMQPLKRNDVRAECDDITEGALDCSLERIVLGILDVATQWT